MKEYLAVDENELRGFLLTLSPETLYFSHLFGMDLVGAPIESIVSRVISLAYEVSTLKTMIENDFKSSDDVKVLRPSDQKTQTIVIQDYYCKLEALSIVMSNDNMRNAYINQITTAKHGYSETPTVGK